MRQLDLSVWRDPLLIENAWKKSWPPESVAELIAEETLLNSSVHKQLVRFACDCAEYGLLHLEELAKELANVIQGIRNWIEDSLQKAQMIRNTGTSWLICLKNLATHDSLLFERLENS